MSKIHELAFNAEEIDELLDSVEKKTIYQDATQSEHGLMSTTDKTKLNSLPTAQQIDNALDAKVDKEAGKGLSKNDYTDAEKAKVASALQTETDPTVPSWAKQQNKPSYDYSEIGNTPDLSGFITKSVNDLANYYLKSETYTQAEVNALIGAIQQFHYEIYATLPQTGQSNVLYLIGPTGSGSDKYEEYVYSNSAFTKIGDTSIDLSGYVTTGALNKALSDYTTTANLTTLLAGKQDTISDLATIRSGAALGATAYQKPLTGIPASDIASGVIPTVPVQNVTVGGTSVLSNGVAVVPAIPTVPTISTNIASDATSDTKTTSPKAVKTFVEGKGYGTYSKPQDGIPESDLSSDVQQALQKHFKGWYDSSSNLPDNPVVGDYAYVKGATSTDPAVIYECTTNGSWSNSGRTADTSNVQTFESGEEVNEIGIDDSNLNNPHENDLAMAIDIKPIKERQIIDGILEQLSIRGVVNGTSIEDIFEIGNITINPGSTPTYSASTSRVRTKKDVRIILKKGDVISFSNYSSLEYYIGYYSYEDNTFKTPGAWRSTNYTAPADGEYYFVIRVPSSTASVTVVQFIQYLELKREMLIADYFGKKFIGTRTVTSTNSALFYRYALPYNGTACFEFDAVSNIRLIDIDFYQKEGTAYTNVGYVRNMPINSPIFVNIPNTATHFVISIVSRIKSDSSSATLYISKIGSARYDYLFNQNKLFIENCEETTTVKSVNHRGYSTAPENTLSAFRLSKEKGFRFVETDIRFTSDGVAVLLHDESINRTARNTDGTSITDIVNIANITYAEAIEYDFGVYKGSKYAGEKIPTLSEFLLLCKKLGLKAYLELKAGTQSQINDIIDLVNNFGLSESVSYISVLKSYLQFVKTKEPTARLVYVGDFTGSTAESRAAFINGGATLKADNNTVVIDVYPLIGNSLSSEIAISDDDVELCKTNGLELEVWTIDGYSNINRIIKAIEYITGFTTNNTIASLYLELYETAK